MIFPKKHIKPILQGKVTLLVHPHRPTDNQTLADGTVVPLCPLQLGRTYSVKASGTGPEISRFRPTGYWEANLHELTDAEAREAGFVTWESLRVWWFDRYNEGPGARDEPRFPVMVVPVWMVRFELYLEQPVSYLRPGPRGGYTTNPSEAMREGADVEWCPPGGWVKDNAKGARERFSKTHAEEEARLGARSRAAKLKEVESRAQKQGLDLAEHAAKIDAEIAEMRRKLTDEAA